MIDHRLFFLPETFSEGGWGRGGNCGGEWTQQKVQEQSKKRKAGLVGGGGGGWGGGGGGRGGVRGRVQSRRDGEFFDPILKVNSKVILGQPAR